MMPRMTPHPTMADHLRRLMRREGVTIHALAAAMNVPLKRVREVYHHGLLPADERDCSRFWQDWLDGVEAATAAMHWNDRVRVIEAQAGRASA